MKYKLINTENKAEFVCEKIEIHGFEYYTTVEKNISDNVWYYNDWCKGIFYNCIPHKAPLELYSKSAYWNEFIGKGKNKLIIASNNPTLDIPQVVDEAYMFADDYEEYNSDDDGTTIVDFMNGYNKAKEQYPYTKQDMIEFVRFSMAKELTSDRIKNLAECLELFEQQRPKTIYFK